MPVEQAQYLDTLTPEWPLGTDPQKDGDDHIRMIKQVLQNTFPNLNGAVTGTPAQLNSVAAGMIFQAADAANKWPKRWALTDPSAPGTAVPVLSATATGDELRSHPTLLPTWEAVRNMIYPVGSVIINTGSANPSTWLGFGTWVQQKGYVAAVGAVTDAGGLAVTIGAGFYSGNWRVQNGHIVSQTLNLASGVTDEEGDHTHGIKLEGSDNSGNTAITSSNDDNVGTVINSNGAGRHTHGVTGTITIGSSGLNAGSAFQQPRTGYYVWVRTA